MNVNNFSNNNHRNVAFGGNIILKGREWVKNPQLKETFINSPFLKAYTHGYDIVGRLHKSGRYYGVNLYEIKISLLKEGSLLDKVKDFFGFIHKKPLTSGPHRASTLQDAIEDPIRLKDIFEGYN